MQRTTLVPTWLAVIAISGLVASCGNDPKSPTNPTAPSASSVEITSIEISGPDSVAPGQSAQFTALIRLSDGTTKGATTATHVVWRSSNTSMLQVASDSGIVTARQQLGEVTVSGEVATTGGVRRDTKEVIIVPDGTYRLIGTVVDAEFDTFGLAGARVEVTPGSLVATTDSNGKYRLYGVPAEATIRVTADGYEPYQQSLHLAGHVAHNVDLTPSGPLPTLIGNYTLALDVTDGCQPGGSIPALATDLRHRRYDAVLTRSGSDVEVTLTESRFRVEYGLGNHFSGTVTGNRATFTFGDDLGYGYVDVIEQLPNNTFLIPVGTAVTTLTPSGLVSGQLSGSPSTGVHALMNFDSRFPEFDSTVLGGCFGSIRFTLTSR